MCSGDFQARNCNSVSCSVAGYSYTNEKFEPWMWIALFWFDGRSALVHSTDEQLNAVGNKPQ